MIASNMRYPWHIFLLLPIVAVQNAPTFDITSGPDIVNCTFGEKGYYIAYMWENNHNFKTEALLFLINGVSSKPSLSFLSEYSFSYTLEIDTDISTAKLYSTQYFDYESNQKTFMFRLSNTDIVVLNVMNYDDESPTLTSPMCSMKENTDYEENTECTATLTDTDGWITQTTFEVINSNPNAKTDLEKEDQLFNFDIDRSLDDSVTSTTVKVTTKQQLDYEAKIFYSFAVQAKDGAGHSTIPNEDVTCIINVIDQNDQPPQFTSYFTTQQITEKTEYSEYSVKAVDGDKGINADIHYFIEPIDSEEAEDPFISINQTTGQLLFKPIDRDAKDLLTYQFQIRAQEIDEPPFNTTVKVTLFLDDLDDNSPLVMSLVNASGEVIDYKDVSLKIVNISIMENFADTLDGTVTITDIDTGNNALFNVELMEHPNSTEEYTKAFFIVPTAGYRTADFEVSVKNAIYLDYENPPWDNFQFYIHSSGKLNSTKEDSLLVQISLIDYNDEIPKFPNANYECWVNETIKKGEEIIQVKATDRDAEDAILTHKLVGAASMIKTMDINVEEGIITVAIDDAFDYDRINPIVFQVEAVDHAEHTTTVPVTVNLLDINNKAPTYKAEVRIEVEENQDIGTVLNTSITASDVDTTRNLTAKIDWDSSYVVKNSQRKDNDDPLIHDAMRFVDLDFKEIGEDGTIDIQLKVNDVNPEGTAPDYETFEVLYLSVIITDLNTLLPDFQDKMNTIATITINIIDINDNAPEFTNATINKKRTVYEAANNVIVGNIEAIDLDVGDIVKYSCTYTDERYDWFVSDTDGQISVKDGSKIDCDTDKIMYVDINCTATDGLHYTPHIFSIDILDVNNKVPQLNITSASDIEIFEKSEWGTPVTSIDYEDDDRDVPFHTATCELDDYGSDCNGAFEIKNNTILVKNGAVLDRDEGIKNYICHVTCIDNPKNVDDQGHNSNDTSFTIVLKDINDHYPILQTFDLAISENTKKDTDIGAVQAEDIDEGVNADIDFKIVSITKNNEDFTPDIFDIVEKDDYRVNDTVKQWHLIAKTDLVDAYGTYVLHLNLSDRGNPPKYTESSDYIDKYGIPKLTVTINKFNYYQPEFIVPNKNDANSTQFYLSLDQQDDTVLMWYNDNKFLNDFQINNVPDGCSKKWDPIFTIKQISPDTPTFFTISQNECTAQLQVHNYEKNQAKSVVKYTIKVTATLATEGEKQPDEKEYSTTIDISVVFVDNDQEPMFDDTDKPCVLHFLQDRLDDDNSTSVLDRQAHYPKADLSSSIFYFIITEDEAIEDTFEVDENSGSVSLKQKLYYNEQKLYTFKILASRNQSKMSTNDNSYLTVEINVVDSNIHVPQWTQASFYGAIMKNTVKGTSITSVKATDEDEIDQGKLKYSKDGDIVVYGSDNIKGIPEPFVVKENTGEVSLNFVVDYNMWGYFKFTVKVEDAPDPYDNPYHENTTTITINIVTDENTATFRFENSLDEVTNNRLEILNIISRYVGWDCHDQNIQRDSQNGQELSNVTVASIYCIDDDKLQTSSDILKKLSNINTFLNLRKDLMAYSIWLQAFTSEATAVESLEQVLKIALIIVTVILGTLCVILAVTFFLKIRGLNQRLSKLTEHKFGSDESNLNRKAINAPNTNMFAIEGSNPVFNNEIIKDNMFDKQSIHSADSDLIGVEDDPEFDMFGEEAGKKERF